MTLSLFLPVRLPAQRDGVDAGLVSVSIGFSQQGPYLVIGFDMKPDVAYAFESSTNVNAVKWVHRSYRLGQWDGRESFLFPLPESRQFFRVRAYRDVIPTNDAPYGRFQGYGPIYNWKWSDSVLPVQRLLGVLAIRTEAVFPLETLYTREGVLLQRDRTRLQGVLSTWTFALPASNHLERVDAHLKVLNSVNLDDRFLHAHPVLETTNSYYPIYLGGSILIGFKAEGTNSASLSALRTKYGLEFPSNPVPKRLYSVPIPDLRRNEPSAISDLLSAEPGVSWCQPELIVPILGN